MSNSLEAAYMLQNHGVFETMMRLALATRQQECHIMPHRAAVATGFREEQTCPCHSDRDTASARLRFEYLKGIEEGARRLVPLLRQIRDLVGLYEPSEHVLVSGVST